MEDLLFTVEITPQIIYLTLILIVIGNGLKDVPFIEKWMIIWVLLTISILVEFTFLGINFKSLFEAVMSSSFATMAYQTYKQTKIGVRLIRNRK
jgi:hypothetical protein